MGASKLSRGVNALILLLPLAVFYNGRTFLLFLASGQRHMQVGMWDIILVAGVSMQATVMAYIFDPRWKALLYSLPIPFTLASMSLGQPIGVTHATGLLVLLAFFHGVRGMHQVKGWHIVPSIMLAAAGYAAIGAGLAEVLPRGGAAFWTTVVLCGGTGLALLLFIPHREEPGHRSPLPIWIKLPTVAGVIGFLVLMKQYLEGFMAMFPMMGVVTAYEGRHSLWTMSRQVPVLLLTFPAMMSICRLLQGRIGLGASLLIGWCVHLTVLYLVTRWMWWRADRATPQ
jgi:hypothetical protein